MSSHFVQKTVSTGAVFLGIAAWLLPNHYSPWLSFHSEATMGMAVALLGIIAFSRRNTEWPHLALMITLLGIVPLVQAQLGLLYFSGSAWMACLYLTAFALSVVAGRALHQRYPRHFVPLLFSTFLVAAMLSSGIAMYQWLELDGLAYAVIDLPPGDRPFANLGQPNHLATLLYWGLIAGLLAFERKDIGPWTLALLVTYLGVVMAATQSRTGLLECISLVVVLFLWGQKSGLRIQIKWAVIGLACLMGLFFSWKNLSQSMAIPVQAGEVNERLAVGTRPEHWQMLLDALANQPWLGYGWDQVAEAHLSTALEHPATSEIQEHSHNVILDLLIWNGIPLGGLVVLVFMVWMWRQIMACRDASSLLLLSALLGLGVHAMLEYPAEYAYFLLPAGLMMGALGATAENEKIFVVKNFLTFMPWVVAVTLFYLVVVDYGKIEENYRNLRFQAAGVGTSVVSPKLPDTVVLDQLKGLLFVGRTTIDQNMPSSSLAMFKAVSFRYPNSTVLMKNALALGLNGRPDEAGVMLQLLCKRHYRHVCVQSIRYWTEVSVEAYPQLRAVPLPKDLGVQAPIVPLK